MRRRSWRRRGRQRWVDPTCVHAPVKAVGGLGIDSVAVQNQTTERHLDMTAWAAEAVVQIKVPKRRIEIVAPEQTDDTPAKPDAFRIARRPVQRGLCFGKFIDFLHVLAVVVLGALFRWRGLLVGRFGVVVLRESRGVSAAGDGKNQGCKNGSGA